MIDYSIDSKKNTVFISFTGKTKTEDASKLLVTFVNLCSQMSDGFTIISNMRTMQINSTSQLTSICSISNAIFQKTTISKIIRIVPEDRELEKALIEVDKEFLLENIYYTYSKEEALKLVSL
jgi:hypothetical protein